MIRKAFLAKGAVLLLLASSLVSGALGCSAGDQQESEAPGDTAAVRANMVYYAMPG